MNVFSPKKKRIVVLKGKSKNLNQKGKKGKDFTLNFFGCTNNGFGFFKKKLRPSDLMLEKGSKILHNVKLQSLGEDNFRRSTAQNFRKLKLTQEEPRDLLQNDYEESSIRNSFRTKLREICKNSIKIRLNQKNFEKYFYSNEMNFRSTKSIGNRDVSKNCLQLPSLTLSCSEKKIVQRNQVSRKKNSILSYNHDKYSLRTEFSYD